MSVLFFQRVYLALLVLNLLSQTFNALGLCAVIAFECRERLLKLADFGL